MTYALGLNLFEQGTIAGAYYNTIERAAGATNTTLNANWLYLQPIFVRRECVWTRIGVNCALIDGTALCRLGIYANKNGVPDSLILDAGVVDMTATGERELTISQTLERNWHWLAVQTNSTGSRLQGPIANAFATMSCQWEGRFSYDTQVVTVAYSRTYSALPSSVSINWATDVFSPKFYQWLRMGV